MIEHTTPEPETSTTESVIEAGPPAGASPADAATPAVAAEDLGPRSEVAPQGDPTARDRESRWTAGMVQSLAARARFPLLGQGYDPASVDGFLDELDHALADVVAAADEHQATRGDLERLLEERRASESALAELEARLQAVSRERDQLAERQRDEDDVREAALAEADAIREAARMEADDILNDAHQRARESDPAADGPPNAEEREEVSSTPVARAADPSGLPLRDRVDPGAQTSGTVVMAIEAIRAIADMAISQMVAPAPTSVPASRALRPEPTRSLQGGPRRADRPLLESDAEFLATLRRSVADRPAPRAEIDQGG